MKWAELTGAGAKRFCGECALHVVDGSAMTKSAAVELVQSNSDRVCMRVAIDGDGQAVHQPEIEASRPRKLAGIGLTIASTMLVACGEELKEPTPHAAPLQDPSHSAPAHSIGTVRPPEILGKMTCLEPNPTETMGGMRVVAPPIAAPDGPSLDQNQLDGKGAVGADAPKE